MIHFIWQIWKKNKERLILLLIGALIISSGLSYLIGISHSATGTIHNTLQKEWKSSYDILVQPSGSHSSNKKHQLLQPGFLESHTGGISQKQYQQIKKIKGIQVAAPIAVLGYTNMNVSLPLHISINKPGIYHVTFTESENNGIHQVVTKKNKFYFSTARIRNVQGVQDGFDSDQLISSSQLLVGVDPRAEAKLVGLKDAVLPFGKSRYFSLKDHARKIVKRISIPIIMRNATLVHQKYTYQISRLNLPYSNSKDVQKTLRFIKKGGGKTYLKKIKRTPYQNYSTSSKKIYRTIVENISGTDPATEKTIKHPTGYLSPEGVITFKASGLAYKKITSPFPKKWPFTYRLLPKGFEWKHIQGQSIQAKAYRKRITYPANHRSEISYHFIGLYDPSKLHLPNDPLNQLPLGTYRPPEAKLILDANGDPVNPPKQILPTGMTGFLTPPPSMITTLDAAEKLVGKNAISAIRIKVAGVQHLNNKSQAKVTRIAKEIRTRTGLKTAITLGASPQPTLIHVPKAGDWPALGWVDEPWTNIGTAIKIFKQSNLGYLGITFSVLLVAIIYVLAANLVSMLSRKKQFAVLLTVGWRPSRIRRMIMMESTLLGCIVAIISWVISYVVETQSGGNIEGWRIFLVGVCGFIIYLLGAILPAQLAAKILPYEAIQNGEISIRARRVKKSHGLFSMAYSHLLGKFSRNFLSILAIAIPTMLVTFFIFITVHLNGILYTTTLGQYITVKIGTTQYISAGIAVLISILTTSEIMWQNIIERKEEIFLLKAVGWQDHAVRRLILLEGFFTGMFAGIVGVIFALIMVWMMYAHFPIENLWLLIACGIIPLIIGTIGAWFPAQKAVRSFQLKGMNQSA